MGAQPAATEDAVRDTITILAVLHMNLARVGEDVHAGRAQRLAGHVGDGTVDPSEALTVLHDMARHSPQHIRPRVDQAVTDLTQLLADFERSTEEPDAVPEKPPASCRVPEFQRCQACGTCIGHDGCADDDNPVKPGDCGECGACLGCITKCDTLRSAS